MPWRDHRRSEAHRVSKQCFQLSVVRQHYLQSSSLLSASTAATLSLVKRVRRWKSWRIIQERQCWCHGAPRRAAVSAFQTSVNNNNNNNNNQCRVFRLSFLQCTITCCWAIFCVSKWRHRHVIVSELWLTHGWQTQCDECSSHRPTSGRSTLSSATICDCTGTV